MWVVVVGCILSVLIVVAIIVGVAICVGCRKSYPSHHRHRQRHSYNEPTSVSTTRWYVTNNNKPTSISDMRFEKIKYTKRNDLVEEDGEESVPLQTQTHNTHTHDRMLTESSPVSAAAAAVSSAATPYKKKLVGSETVNKRKPLLFNVGVAPSDIAILENNRLAFVTNSNSYGIRGGSTVTVLDLEKKLSAKTISDASFDEPYRLASNKKGTKVYVCNSATPRQPGQQGTVSIIDVETLQVSGTMKGFDGPSGIVITNSKAYVINYGAGATNGFGKTVSVVDLHRKKIVATIVVAQAPAAITLSPCKEWMYVVSYVDGVPGTGVFQVIRRKTHQVVASLAGFFGPFGVAVTPSGHYAYVTNFGSNNFEPYGTTVSVVDVRTPTAPKTIAAVEVGIQPAAIAAHPDGKHIYVSNYNALYAHPDFKDLTPGEGTVSVIRVRDNVVVPPTFAVGETPASLKFSPDGSRLYICKYTQRTVLSFQV